MASEKTITLYMNELMYDISNKAHLTGLSKKDATSKDVYHMQVTEDDNVRRQVVRSLMDAYSSLKDVLSEWVTPISAVVSDDTLTIGSTLVYILNVPSNYNDSMLKSVTDAMHNYIVDKTLAEWFSITDKEDSEFYASKATTDVAKMKEAIYARKRPIRTTT